MVRWDPSEPDGVAPDSRPRDTEWLGLKALAREHGPFSTYSSGRNPPRLNAEDVIRCRGDEELPEAKS